MSKIAMTYVENSSQKKISISEGEVVPLGFEDLSKIIKSLDQPIEFPLNLKGVVIEKNEFTNFDPNLSYNISATLNSNRGSKIIGLINGGWLPSGLTVSDNILLPDRCTVAAIRSHFLGGFSKNNQSTDFLDFIVDYPIKINPLLYALEGNNGIRSPNAEELSELFERASIKILEALPNAIIIPDKKSAIQGFLGIISDTADGFIRKKKFLIKIAPLITPSISRKNHQQVWKSIINYADKYDINKASILILAVLSASSENQSTNPAKKLIKPKKHFTEKDAYNVLCDLRSLDLLIGLITDFPDQRVALLTEDKALALLWTGLQTHNHQRKNNAIHFDIDVKNTLFKNITDEDFKEMLDLLN